MAAASYKFSDNPPAQLIADFKTLNELNATGQLEQFVAIALAFLSGGSGGADAKSNAGSPQEMLDAFAAQYKAKPGALKNTVASVLYFFSESLKKNLSAKDVSDDLQALGLSADKSAALCEQYKRQFVSLSASAIAKTLTVNALVDIEWKFGVTASSSELRQAGTCFLQLKLVVDRGGHKENVLMELTLPQFYQFQQQMQNAQKLLG